MTPLTRAEATNYAETSTHADVLAFLDALQRSGAPVRLGSLGKSAEGRAVPLVVAGRPLPADASEARAQGRLIVYIQANIHGGEVEGKEAALMLLRDLCQRDKKRLLEKLVLLIAPIYNADGNESWGEGRRNRPGQDGPARIGQRASGQGLDLNRDCIKAESPEMRGVLREVYAAWNPDAVFDLHTTNGTRHGWHLTYAPPTHPDTPGGVLRYSRDELLPELRKRLKRERGWELFDYGNAERRESERVWATFGPEPRYVSNYAGLRGSVAVLSEAVSFLPFRFRVESTYQFVRAALEVLARDAAKVRRLRQRAPLPAELGVRFAMASRGIESIPLERPRPENEIDHTKAPTALERVSLPVYDRWRATRSARVPQRYYIPLHHSATLALLRRHGIELERLVAPYSGRADVFILAEKSASPPFQGHRMLRLEGRWHTVLASLSERGCFARTDQPLGALLFHLLEPESLDGVAAWNFLDDALTVGEAYPIFKIF